MRTAVRGKQMSKADPIQFTYRDRTVALSPETSLKIRKIAEQNKVSVEVTLNDILQNAQCVGNGLFLPAEVLALASAKGAQ